MLSREEFIRISFEINLFFQRIMKEHLFFFETSISPAASGYISEARALKRRSERLLAETVKCAKGIISENAIRSGDIVTPYTLRAEEVTSRLTGVRINMDITRAELELASNKKGIYNEKLENIVYDINKRSLKLLDQIIAFQNDVLAHVLKCKVYTTLYPELIEHVTHEAIYYSETLKCLQDRRFPKRTLCEQLNFWNKTMGEHAQFIDGLLDPTERSLKQAAQTFANRFEMLVEECNRADENAIIQESADAAKRVRSFKAAATAGLIKCEIKSIILPLLADHVLREANHYLKLLNQLTYW